MSRRGDRERLADMLDALQRATSYIADISYEEFLGDLSVTQTLLHTLIDLLDTNICIHQLKALGTPSGSYDLQIAAIALTHSLTLVTHNTREFSRVDGLPLADWEAETP